MSSYGDVSAQGVDGKLFPRIISEAVTDVRVLTDVQIAARNTYDERADIRVLRYVDAKEPRKVWRIVILVQNGYQYRGSAG